MRHEKYGFVGVRCGGQTYSWRFPRTLAGLRQIRDRIVRWEEQALEGTATRPPLVRIRLSFEIQLAAYKMLKQVRMQIRTPPAIDETDARAGAMDGFNS